MYATDYFTDVSYKPNSEVPMRTVVVVNCREGYENFNSGINRCVGNDDNQEWADLFRCVRLCDQSPMIRNHRYSTQCIGNSGLTDCKTDTHILDTELRVTCAPGFEAYNDTNQMGKHICDDDGSWRTKEVNPKCEAICGIKSKHHPNVTPWKVSLFERASAPDSTYSFKCSGTILSPYVVLTAISCFDGRPKEDDGRSYYSVIEGDYNVSYKESDEHGYLIHFIADINTVTHPESKVPQAALIILVKPFQFGAKIRPICFDTSVSEENVALESPGDFSEFKKGESVVKGPVNDKYYSLTHLVVSNVMSYNVEAFAKAINETIQNSENIF
ncbi:modular serine protease-like [Drosophila nasuta]|uniref:modular serine protease-like n=1 Tax=Drosophila nasuta TaxID=42062 RepID=UPI00295EEBE1|nr:modular serine protease-like [Drosophila nasuta]